MIAAHLPALQVVIPLAAAPLCVFLRRGFLAWIFSVLITWAAFAISIALLSRVLDSGTISYAMGGWPPPWGIEYRIDKLNAFVLLIVSGIGAVVAPYALHTVRLNVADDRQHYFFAMFLLAFAGLLGIVITGDAFNLYVFLEISSLASYTLIAMGRDRRSRFAAFQYLILGTLGATLFLIGVGLLYMMTGTLNIADLATRVTALEDQRTIIAAFAFLTVGISLKLALFPLHLWLPNSYTYAPTMVSAFLAATATKVGVYVLLRFAFTVFGVRFSFDLMPLGEILLVLGLAAAFVGSLVAIFQEDVKRMLAYSSVAQIGYIAVGISFASENGLIAGTVHLFNHALIKGGLFLAVGCVFYRLGSVDVTDMRGLGRDMPFTFAAFVIGGLSLMGVPLTVGFVSKWYLVIAALERGQWPVAALVLVSSLLAMIYIWRIVEAAYFQPRPEGAAAVAEAPLSMIVPTWILIGTTVYFGLDTDLTVGTARLAARVLLGGLP